MSNGKSIKLNLYQIDLLRDMQRVGFLDWENKIKHTGKTEIDWGIYDKTFAGTARAAGLEDLYCVFNSESTDECDPPRTCRSMSVSDIVEIIEAEDIEQGVYYCDSIGFKRLAEKVPETFAKGG